MITSSPRVRNFERGFFGRLRTSDENLRAFHLAIVLRLTPYRLARAVFFSSLAWIASRTLGVVFAEPCVRLGGSRPRRNGMMPPGSRASLADGLLSPAVVLGQAFLDCFAWVRRRLSPASSPRDEDRRP